MPASISAVICTHNPRPDCLARVLDSLRRQTLPASDWELLVVDNKSTPPLAPSLDLSWHPRARVVREENPGLTHARLRGLVESDAPLLVYVDDDNLLAPDYLAAALRLASDMPFIGVWSAKITGEFELPPEPWMRPYLPYLALTDFESDRWSNHHQGRTLPVGAGMVARRVVLAAYEQKLRADPRRLGLDRKGSSLLAGGDTDIGLAACSIGLGCAYMTALRVTHIIPAFRLRRDYLTRLVEDITASHRWLDFMAHFSEGRPDAPKGGAITAVLHRYGGPLNLLRFAAAKFRGRRKAAALLRDATRRRGTA
jgi:glycosyltransferase involved in cell wall biosynthesis